MKKLILALLTVLLIVSCTSQPETGFKVTGQIEGLPDGTRVQLLPVSHDSELAIADTVVTNGTFVLKGELEQPLAAVLLVKDGYGSKRVMLENTKTRVVGKITFSEYADGNKSYNFDDVRVEGSPLSSKYEELMNVRKDLDELYKSNNEKHKEISNLIGEARAAKNQALMDSITATDAYKAMSADEKMFFETVEKNYNQCIMDNKDTFWGPLMMISLFSYFNESTKPLYEVLSQEAKDSYYGQKVKEELYPVGKEGTTVAPFTVTSAEGKATTLAELSAGKKYILIDFWASWCNPCRKEIPKLKQLYAKYAPKGFEIISISIDKKEADWAKAIKEEQMTWPNFLDNGDIASLYKVKFVPTMYLVDEQGVMIGENLRDEELAAKMAELFN